MINYITLLSCINGINALSNKYACGNYRPWEYTAAYDKILNENNVSKAEFVAEVQKLNARFKNAK